jgi:hypothetical protein
MNEEQCSLCGESVPVDYFVPCACYFVAEPGSEEQ